MAMHIKNRGYNEITTELFFNGYNSALWKCYQVRHTQYEIKLYEEYGRPLKEIDNATKVFFNYAFYRKAKGETKKEKWINARQALDYAVGDGTGKDKSCYARCLKLMRQLNECIPQKDKIADERLMILIDWLTFNFSYCEDALGNIIYDDNYGYPLVNWFDKYNFIHFKSKLCKYMMAKQQVSYKRIFDEVFEECYIKCPEMLILKYPCLG